MPGFLLHEGAMVLCAHSGQAEPPVPQPRVRVGGQPVAVQPVPYTVSGCQNLPPPPSRVPCVSAQWKTGATRIKVLGEPVLLADSAAICTPTGTGLSVAATQTRVKGI